MTAHFSWYLSGGLTNTSPANSLGGPRSTVAVVPANLFPDVSSDEATIGSVKHRGIYVINDGDKPSQDTFLWIATTTSTTYDTLAIAAADEGFNIIMETIPDDTIPPVGPLFTSGRTKGLGIFLDNFGVGAYIGIWVKRYVIAGAQAHDNSGFTLTVEGLVV